MASTITTTVTELPESRVRVQAEVPPEEVRKSVEKAARELSRSVRVPGFRSGKVPPQVIISRVGREAVLQDAVRDSLNRWYVSAISAAKVVPIGDPELDVYDLPDDGEPLKFSIEIGVLPKAKLGEYKGLEVGKREIVVDEDAISEQVETLRERMAKLEVVETAAETGDFILIDYTGTVDGTELPKRETREQLVELGSDQLIAGLDEQLVGVKPGEERTVTLSVPVSEDEAAATAGGSVGDETKSSDTSEDGDDDAATAAKDKGADEVKDAGADEVKGEEADEPTHHDVVLSVKVKEVRQKLLPELDDDFALEAGFDTLDELKTDIRTRMQEREQVGIDREFRDAAVDAAVANASIEIPADLIQARARELWHQVLHSLKHQGIEKQMYLQITGKTEEQILEEMSDEAEIGIKREAVLAAVAETEKIEPTDDELVEAIESAVPESKGTTGSSKTSQRSRKAGQSGKNGKSSRKLLERLKSNGRLDSFRATVTERQALELLVEQAKPIPIEQAEAREKIWTPSKKESGDPEREGLWTPGSK